MHDLSSKIKVFIIIITNFFLKKKKKETHQLFVHLEFISKKKKKKKKTRKKKGKSTLNKINKRIVDNDYILSSRVLQLIDRFYFY